MSEWYPCPKCGLTHENMTACPEPPLANSEETNPYITLASHIHSGLRRLTTVCDGAHERDDQGFAAADVKVGHELANLPELITFDAISMGRHLCNKYRKQLGEEFMAKLIQLDLEEGLDEMDALEAPAADRPHEDAIRPRMASPEAILIDKVPALARPAQDPILSQPLDSVFPLTDEQEGAIELIRDWFDSTEKGGEFKLGGYAGTGKTTIINTVRYELRCHSIVAAFTGKAVNVLQRKGVSAQTLHSLMYDVHENKDGTIEFTKKLVLKDDPNLIIVDEASMISTELYTALKSFKVPLLFVGDPGQLEPVGDNPNLMAKPDFVLSKIHRQAEKSPIVRFATDVRLAKTEPRFGKLIPPVDYINETDLIVKQKVVSASEYFSADQIICAKNKTRTNLNQKIRSAKGYPPGAPVVGEKLICLRNNRQLGIFNGMLLFVRAIVTEGPTYWLCNLEDEVGREYGRIKVWKEPFIMPLVQGVKVPYLHAYCDYGYVITCHKSQGSEWDHVIVLDEWMPPTVWDMKRWRYTAITRAAKKLTYCV